MVIVDSSESSSDEEDRRLRPIRRCDRIESGTRTRLYDAAARPENSSSRECFPDLTNGHGVSSFQTSYQSPNTVHNIPERVITDQQIAEDITNQIIAHTKSLENFVRKIEQIPSRSLSSKKFHIGLQLINEYIQSIRNVDDNVSASNVVQYTSSIQTADNYMEGWYNGLECRDYFPLPSDKSAKDVRRKHKVRNMKDACSQTNISGAVIPREATAALEFFQELIKNS